MGVGAELKIKQSLESGFIGSLFSCRDAVHRHLQNKLQPLGVNWLQAMVLVAIQLEGRRQIRPGELAIAMRVSRASMSQTLAYLEKDRLIFRQVAHDDLRVYQLGLTDSGSKLANEVIRIVDRLEVSLEQTLGASRFDLLTQDVHAMTKCLSTSK